MSAIRVRVLLFARARELRGAAEVEMSLEPPVDVGDCFASLAAGEPGLEALRERLLVAVNEEYADWTTALHDGDVVALIPPVSGGSVGAR